MGKLTFITYEQIIKDADVLAETLPKHDLVCAIPRSGLLPAFIIATRWHVPITTPGLMVENYILNCGRRIKHLSKVNSVLVVDDSTNSGFEIKETKKLLKDIPKEVKVTYAAIYGSDWHGEADYIVRRIPQPRMFEWNWLNHDNIEQCGMDMDGVLCEKPTPEQNDYGPNYEKFLAETAPKYIPARKIRAIITGRLEKYRPQTEAWLKKHGVQYEELLMRADAKESHSEHKIKNCLKIRTPLFVEDEYWQAEEISNNINIFVLCVSNWKVHPK